MLDVTQQGDGPLPIVALHGIQGTRASWQPVVAAAAGRPWRWVLPNLRGRGAALRGVGPSDYTLEAYAGDLAAVLAARVPQGPFVLAGWSLGVSIALAAIAAGRIRLPAALLLVSGSPALCETRWFEGDGDALTASVIARRQRLGLREHADDDAVRDTWRAVRETDQRPQLGALFPPTRVLHGSADEDCPLAHGHWLADCLGAPLQLQRGVGHALLSEAPAAVVDALDLLCKNR